MIRDCAVPIPHGETAGQDPVCHPSVEGGEDGRVEIGTLRPLQDGLFGQKHQPNQVNVQFRYTTFQINAMGNLSYFGGS